MKNKMERKLLAVITALISNGTIFHQGYIMDAGANNGKSTFFLRKMFVNRTVLAVDPLQVNINKIKSTADNSIQTLRGFLGATHSTMAYSSEAEKKVGNQIGKISMWKHLMTKNLTQKVDVYTVDQLFQNKKLAFAHWDLENSEYEMLQGAQTTIRRDHPIFTVETHFRHLPENHEKVLKMIHSLEYTCFTIKESCGWSDCRNHLCAPHIQMTQIKEIIAKKKNPKKN